MIGLIGAMPMEVALLTERLENPVWEQVGPHRFCRGRCAGREAVVLCCGIGKVNAAMGAQALIQKYSPKAMLHVGVGGSLTGALGILDVLVARDCVQYDVDTSAMGDPPGFVSTVNRIDFPCDPAISGAILQCADFLRREGRRVELGRVGTGDRFLTGEEEKRAVAEGFGALTCDQESCAIAQVCLVNEVPCAVIRAVSDASDGAHSEEYESHAPEAARLAALLAWNFLESCDFI